MRSAEGRIAQEAVVGMDGGSDVVYGLVCLVLDFDFFLLDGFVPECERVYFTAGLFSLLLSSTRSWFRFRLGGVPRVIGCETVVVVVRVGCDVVLWWLGLVVGW